MRLRVTLDGVLALAGPSVAVVLDPETLAELDRMPLVRPLDMATRLGADDADACNCDQSLELMAKSRRDEQTIAELRLEIERLKRTEVTP